MNAVIKETSNTKSIRTTEVVSWLLSHGIITVTNEELSVLLGVPNNQLPQRLAPLVKRREIISPCQGFWVPIPFEYRQWGAPEGLYYVDRMMRYLDIDYYIGWFNAAALLGASHHAVQVFQVATNKQLRNKFVGCTDYRFFQRSNVGKLPVFRYTSQIGTANVSTRAATMLSVVNDLNLVAGLDNATNIIIELSDNEESFISEISACFSLFPISALRRLGYILENYTETSNLDELVEISQKNAVKISKLSFYKNYSGHINNKWSLDINERINPDV